MGVSTGEWIIAIMGALGALSSVALGAMLASVRGVQIALWAAINESRREISDHYSELTELRGRFEESQRSRRGS